MSVLQRKELEDSPLADLHAIASELGVEGYRALRKEDLVSAVLEAQGVSSEPVEPVEDVELADEGESETGVAAADEEEGSENGGRTRKPRRGASAGREEKLEEQTGVLEIRSNGGGLLTVEGKETQVYVSPAQIRRCGLLAGDQVTGPVRPPRRNQHHSSLVQVALVNGEAPDSGEKRKGFGDLPAVHPTERLSGVEALGAAPIGKGSRVALVGQAGAGATALLRNIAKQVAALPEEVDLTILLAEVRPEEATEWNREENLSIVGGSYDQVASEVGKVADRALDRAKRIVERGDNAIVLIDSLEGLAPATAKRVFGAGRKIEEGGSLTVIAAMRPDSEHLRLATTSVTLDGGQPGGPIAPEQAHTLRADLLG